MSDALSASTDGPPDVAGFASAMIDGVVATVCITCLLVERGPLASAQRSAFTRT